MRKKNVPGKSLCALLPALMIGTPAAYSGIRSLSTRKGKAQACYVVSDLRSGDSILTSASSSKSPSFAAQQSQINPFGVFNTSIVACSPQKILDKESAKQVQDVTEKDDAKTSTIAFLRSQGLLDSGIEEKQSEVAGDIEWRINFAMSCRTTGASCLTSLSTFACTVIGGTWFPANNSCSAGDSTAPVFQNSTPSQNSVNDTQVVINVDIDEAGSAYAVIVADGATAPTSAEVRNGQSNGGGAPIDSGNVTLNSGGFSGTITLTGLAAGTSYDVYVVAEDDEGTPNRQASPTRVDITTSTSPEINLQGNSQTISDGMSAPPRRRRSPNATVAKIRLRQV